MTISVEKTDDLEVATRLPSDAPLLRVRDLHVTFDSERGPVHAVRGVDFDLRRGETLAIVGESGSGKSTTALALTRMLPAAGRVTGGSVLLDGGAAGPLDLATASERDLRAVRGARIGMIFQDPMTSLNPYLSVKRQMTEVLEVHRGMSEDAATKAAIDLLDVVQIPEAKRRVNMFPHEFSGGMRQRVMIAMALLCEPELLIADEPTTALDVTVQAQILDLLGRLKRDTGMAIALITHDLGVIAGLADRVMVMYAGEIMERADVRPLFKSPQHPYTHGLLRSMPRLDEHRANRLQTIGGQPP
ncbi:MAG: ABC transporter ATP-binding protein, partial [Streptomycetaceae bacterium]|nr:ABC transporter ATP-binding protein [Streptomycetaceae bacterium]